MVHAYIIPVLGGGWGRLKQDSEFKAGLGYTMRLGSQTRKEKKLAVPFFLSPTLSHQDGLEQTQDTDEQNKTKVHNRTPRPQTTDFQHGPGALGKDRNVFLAHSARESG